MANFHTCYSRNKAAVIIVKLPKPEEFAGKTLQVLSMNLLVIPYHSILNYYFPRFVYIYS